MKIAIAVLLITYFSICFLFYIFQRSLLYFPQPADVVDTSAGLVKEISFEAGTGSGAETKKQMLSGWVLNPGQEKALIFYGGNASTVEIHIDFLTHVAPDYSVYLIPYRGYGNNQGKPTEQALYNDAVYIYQQIKKNHQDISLMGRSLGTGVATYVASKYPVEKLILSTPYDSILNVAKSHYPWLPISWLLKDKFLSAERAGKIRAKTLILIAENDETINRKNSEALVKKIDPQLLNYHVILGATHNEIGDDLEYVSIIREFLKAKKIANTK